MIEIKNRYTGAVIVRDGEAETLRDAVIRFVANERAAERSADLSSADLRSADLRSANLRSANLRSANLRSANLSSANLRYADLRSANLRSANLRYADLRSANLRSANLSSADLSSADLSSADLRSANLPSPTAVLLATWGDLSPQLVADLMVFDAANHPNPEAFDAWAKGGSCPYSGVRVQRAANFTEDAREWGKGVSCRPYDLMVRVLAEKCPEWSEERIAEFTKRFEASDSSPRN